MDKKLTIFITNSKSGAFFEIASGWANAFKLGGHNCIMWDGNLRLWDELSPDIFIGCSGWKQNLPNNHRAKIAIHVNPYCNETIQVPGGPIINEQKQAIDWTIKQKPIFVFGYGLQDDMERFWFKWRSIHGINIVGMPNAADITKYKATAPNKDYECDIGWVGGYWDYKAINLDKYLIPVVKKYNSIWLGWSGPKGIWKGKATQDQVLALFSSAKLCPCVVEPHTTKYGIDMPERIFKIAACGAMTISDPVSGIERYFGKDILPIASDHNDYHKLCDNHVNMPSDERKSKANLLKSKILKDHTYLNRVKVFLEAFGYGEESARYNDVIGKVCTR